SYPLPVAFRELSYFLALDVPDSTFLAYFVDSPPEFTPRYSLDTRYKSEVFAHGHIRVNGRQFRQITRAPFHLQRGVRDVKAGHLHLSFTWREIPGDDAHRGRLPRPIGSEETENFPFPDVKAHVGNSHRRPVPFRQTLDRYHVTPFSTSDFRATP